MHEARLYLHAAGTPGPRLPNHHDEVITALDDALWLHAEALKAFKPAAQEALEAVAPTVCAGLRAMAGLMPLELGIEELNHHRHVAAVERRVAAPQLVDLGLAHASAVHHAERSELTKRTRDSRPFA